jgi:hypothetical protein
VNSGPGGDATNAQLLHYIQMQERTLERADNLIKLQDERLEAKDNLINSQKVRLECADKHIKSQDECIESAVKLNEAHNEQLELKDRRHGMRSDGHDKRGRVWDGIAWFLKKHGPFVGPGDTPIVLANCGTIIAVNRTKQTPDDVRTLAHAARTIKDNEVEFAGGEPLVLMTWEAVQGQMRRMIIASPRAKTGAK